MRRVLGALPARVRAPDRARGALRATPSRCWRAGPGARPPSCTRSPAATRSSSPRRSPRPRASCPPASATRSRSASPRSTTPRARSSSCARSSRARPSSTLVTERRGRAIDACIEAGLLLLRGETLAFRHDLARRAVEEGISPVRRRELDRMVLRALERRGDADLARLVHHARRAGDADAIRRLAPAAAEAAAPPRPPPGARALGGGAAGRRRRRRRGAGGRLDRGVPVRAPGSRGRGARARCSPTTRRPATRCATGDALRWLSRVLWWAGAGAEATAIGRPGDRGARGVPGQPRAGDGAERPARSWRCCPSDAQQAIDARACAPSTLAPQARRRRDVAHGLTNLGTATFFSGPRQRARPRADRGGVRARRRHRP